LGPITTALEPLKSQMVVVDGITCRHQAGPAINTPPRSHHDDRQKFTNIPGTNAAGDPNTSTSW